MLSRYGFYGHHVYHGPPCKPAFVEETKEVCHIEPEKVEVHTVVTTEMHCIKRVFTTDTHLITTCEGLRDEDEDLQGGDRLRGRRVQRDRGWQF